MIHRNLIPGKPFKVVSIQASQSPEHTKDAGWFRYVIDQGTNRIEGCRQGTCESVTLAVEQMVVQLNERRMGKFSTPRGRPPAKKTTGE